jgi:ribosomal protein S18 acetylase RimI-like enzyme
VPEPRGSDDGDVVVRLHGRAAAAALRDDVATVWGDAFGPIEDMTAWVDETWDRHRSREDYRLVTAHDTQGCAGFSWGYTGRRGQFWPDLITEAVGSPLDGWVGGHFELVEMAVATRARGRGIGGLLMDAVLAGLPHDRALLGTTSDEADPAPRLYRSRGFRRLGLLRPDAQVMGRRPADPRRWAPRGSNPEPAD